MGKYLELLKQSKEQREETEYELENEAALNQVNIDLHEAKQQVFNKKRELNSAILAKPFNTNTILRYRREIALAEKNIQDIESIKTELFGK